MGRQYHGNIIGIYRNFANRNYNINIANFDSDIIYQGYCNTEWKQTMQILPYLVLE